MSRGGDAVILRGRYLDTEVPTQIVEPVGVIQGLVNRIFRIKALLDAVSAIVAIAALAAIGLSVFISYRPRARKIATAVKPGARRGMVLRLLSAETFITLLISACFTALGALIVSHNIEVWVGWLLAFVSLSNGGSKKRHLVTASLAGLVAATPARPTTA